MKYTFKRVPVTIVLALSLAAISTLASAQALRVHGTIERVEGNTLFVKAGAAGDLRVKLADHVVVFGVSKGTLADVTPGAFIGVGAMPQPDGSQKAVQLTIFAESQRGTGEGFRPWDRLPNGTMTNATVATTVGGVDGQVVTVKYKDGEKKIIVTPETTILAYGVGDKSELKPGAAIAVVNPKRNDDGSLEVARINVGRGGVVPQ
jgi:hypothetical protein